MGGKNKPSFILANREVLSKLTYLEKAKYREQVLPGLNKKCQRLLVDVVIHLVQMRVPHKVVDNEIMVFDDSNDWNLKRMGLSFNVMYFNWPEVPNNRIRASFFKVCTDRRWFSAKRVSVLEPTFGFDTLTMAKSLQQMRSAYLKSRKSEKLRSLNRSKSEALSKKLVTPISEEDKDHRIGTSCCEDPKKFRLDVSYVVTLEEAQKIVDSL